jgi:hypothetical protein
MTLVSSDDDLDWEFAFDSRLGHPAGYSEEPMAKRSKKRCEQLRILPQMQPASMYVRASCLSQSALIVIPNLFAVFQPSLAI